MTTNNYLSEAIRMSEKRFFNFHIGRGGQFHNPGHKTFVGLVSENDIYNRLSLIERDGEGRYYNVYTDETGDEIISKYDLQKQIKDGCVTLEFDTHFDTDVFMTVDHLDEDWLNVIERSDRSFDKEEAIAVYNGYHNDDE